MRALLLLLALVLLPGATLRDQAGGEVAKARLAFSEAASVLTRRAALEQAVRAQEMALAAIRDLRRRSSVRRDMIGEEAGANEARLAVVLSALQRISLAPRLAGSEHPGGPLAGVRAGILLASLTPELEREMTALSAKRQELREIDDTFQTAAEETRRILIALQGARAEIARLRRNRAEPGVAPADVSDEVAAMVRDTLARSEETLKTLPDAPEAGKGGGFLFPVAGEVSGAFGEDGAPRLAYGVEIAARPHAIVRAPQSAIVRFAGRLGDEGGIVALEPEAGVLIIFSGLDFGLGGAGRLSARRRALRRYGRAAGDF